VFELIQNAEDNDYKKVEQKGEVPFISFKVYPGRIIIDSNEDGFAEANVRALCNIGKSSKTGAQGYIGEKGIGFKSVFMVASKAYIQSGPYSFYFKHNKGDMGIGMVNPVWEERPDGELDDPLTRITLTLHDSSEPSELATQRETIIEQFEDLPETLLLFLKKLKRIGVAIYNNEGTVSSSTTYSSRCDGKSHRTTLTKTRLQNGTLTEDTKRYHVIKRQVYGLAKSENRTYTDEEERLKTYATAEVALAFPIGVDSTPIIEHQDVFAFLPIRDFGFSVHTSPILWSRK
jgi:hypothetical protein